MNKRLPVHWAFAWRRVVVVAALTVTFHAALVVRADNVFTGPGLWTDGTKWSGGRPTSSSTAGAVIHGLCAATNEAEIIYGPNMWTAVGDWSDSGRTTGRLDINNTWMSFPTELDIGGDSEYFQEGGTNVMTKGVNVGYGAGYAFSRMHMKNVDYVRIGAASTFGQSAPASGGYAEYLQEGGLFSSSASWTLQNKARMHFKDAVLSMSNKESIGGGSVFIAENCAITNTTGEAFSIGESTFALTNCDIRMQKPLFGVASGRKTVVAFKNTSINNDYYLRAGYAANSTCLWTMADCAWTNTGNNAYVLGYGSNSCVEACFTGKTSIDVSSASTSGKCIDLCTGINSEATLVFSDADVSDIKFSGLSIRFSSAASRSHPRLVYRNISGAKTFLLPTPSTSITGTVVFDNAHFYSTAVAFLGSDNHRLNYLTCNGGVFEVQTSSSETLYFCNKAGQKCSFCVTNAFAYLNGKEVKVEKANGDYTFSFYDSDAGIATNTTWTFTSNASSKGRLIVDGTSGVNVVDVYKLACGSGTNDIHLCGNVFRVNQITGSGVSQKIHFNGGTLRSRGNQATWIPASFSALVEDGGAVFDARHNVTIPARLRHGGTAAKDGGVTKKGAATLTLSSATAHEFTGDVVVEEGTLVATALSNWTLAAGQKIGGAGTLKVGSGFTAGGVRFDAAWEGGLTVDGDVAFAPGSTLDVTGIDKDTEGSRFTILTADSLSGAENISATGAPGKWKLRASATSLSIAKDTGFILLVR